MVVLHPQSRAAEKSCTRRRRGNRDIRKSAVAGVEWIYGRPGGWVQYLGECNPASTLLTVTPRLLSSRAGNSGVASVVLLQ